MKVPIEFIGNDSKFIFDTTDIYVPEPPITYFTSDTESVVLESMRVRAYKAEQQMKEVEEFILTKIGELRDLKVEEQLLDNSELMALLDLLEKVVTELADVRLLLAVAINRYITLSANVYRKNAEMDDVEKKADKIEGRLREEIDKLRETTEIMFGSRAYYKTVDISLLEFINGDAGQQIDKIIATLYATLDVLANMRHRANLVNISLYDIEDMLYIYECWAQQLKILADRLLDMFNDLFVKAQRLWMRLISGSYIRKGENVRLNRDCVKITVSATKPDLTECPEPIFLNSPPPEIKMLEPQVQDCPPCITTTTTTTTTTTEKPTTTTTEPPYTPDCFVHFSGGLMSDIYVKQTFTKIYIEDEMSEIVGIGDYPDSLIAFPKANKGTFDSIGFGKNTRLILYTGKNFTGTEKFNEVGPMLIIHHMHIDYPGMNSVRSKSAAGKLPPIRYLTNMHELGLQGSCKITCI